MGGHHRLPQADATIATRDFRVSEYMETLLFKAFLQMLGQKTVLERASA